MIDKLLKLKCRNCNDIIEVSMKDSEKTCSCGKCSIGLKNNRVYISSINGVGDYILYNVDEEYIFICKKDLEGN